MIIEAHACMVKPLALGCLSHLAHIYCRPWLTNMNPALQELDHTKLQTVVSIKNAYGHGFQISKGNHLVLASHAPRPEIQPHNIMSSGYNNIMHMHTLITGILLRV